jgi:hypothetical protein
MSRVDGQGQSLATELKERGIGAALSVSLSIFGSKFNSTRFRYLHFDLHAGSGVNEEVGCIGSPLVYLGTARAKGIQNYAAHFCELDDDRVRKLLGQPEVSGDRRVFVHHGDNRGLMLAIPQIIRDAHKENPAYAVGSILADPNSTEMSLDELEFAAEECKRLDLIINWNATAYKRMQRGQYLLEVLEKLRRHRAHWLIRRPIGAWNFTLLVGRNVKASEHRAMDFYDLDNSFGQHFMRLATLSEKQRSVLSGQYALPGLQTAVPISPGIQGSARSGDAQGELDL